MEQVSEREDLTEQEQRLIAADFAEHVLPLFEAQYPDDDRPRKAIEAARAFARGEMTKEQLASAEAAARAAATEALAEALKAPSSQAAAASAESAAACALKRYAMNASSVGASSAAMAAGYDAERAWQEERIDEVFAARAVTGA